MKSHELLQHEFASDKPDLRVLSHRKQRIGTAKAAPMACHSPQNLRVQLLTPQLPLAGNRKRYPTPEFKSFASVMRQHVDATREDEMLHRGVVAAVNGLAEYLRSERKRVPKDVLLEAERLECLLFLGYDLHFDGDEPPDL